MESSIQQVETVKATKEEFRNIGHSRMVLTYLQLRLASDDRYNKNFLHYFSSKRLNKENWGPVAEREGWISDSRGTGCRLCLSLLQQDSPKHLCPEVEFKEKY